MRNKKLIVLLSVVTALVLCIVICGATFLVRNVEAYNYYVGAPDYDKEVIAASGLKMNSSIFFIDEGKIKSNIENEYCNIGVINVERKFPDRVSINYVVYGSSFQFRSGDGYCQCYASGRIGGSTAAPVGGYFIVKPRDAVISDVGAYFQSDDGYDFKLVSGFISYMYSTGMTDKQIAERIAFIDLSRDGYMYIRTSAGCSIELRGAGFDFMSLLDYGWSVFADPDPELPVNKATGLIRAYVSKADPDAPAVKCTYSPTDGESYYIENYVRV